MGKFPEIKIASGALHRILDSDKDGEQDDLSLDDNCESIDISDESFEGDEDLECQYERWITQAPLHRVLLRNRLKGGQVHCY